MNRMHQWDLTLLCDEYGEWHLDLVEPDGTENEADPVLTLRALADEIERQGLEKVARSN